MSSTFALRSPEEIAQEAEMFNHVFGEKKHILCDTQDRGYSTPKNMSPSDLALHAVDSGGFIPLWQKGAVLHWRFQERAFGSLLERSRIMGEVQNLLSAAILKWGDAAPVKFNEDDYLWDFEIVIRTADKCIGGACTYASAFFPDAGRHELVIYPRMFNQSIKEQIDTFIHEIGHIFGLRHFFANLESTAWPFELFGSQTRFTIMNYGEHSELTDIDKDDLKRLYAMAWNGALTNINGTPIRFFKPYHDSGIPAESMMTVQHVGTALVPHTVAAYPNGH